MGLTGSEWAANRKVSIVRELGLTDLTHTHHAGEDAAELAHIFDAVLTRRVDTQYSAGAARVMAFPCRVVRFGKVAVGDRVVVQAAQVAVIDADHIGGYRYLEADATSHDHPIKHTRADLTSGRTAGPSDDCCAVGRGASDLRR